MIFLIHYDPRAGKLLSFRQFDDSERGIAEEARLQLEISLHRNPRNEEVVILEADSEAVIRRTHRRYFQTVDQMIATSDVGR